MLAFEKLIPFKPTVVIQKYMYPGFLSQCRILGSTGRGMGSLGGQGWCSGLHIKHFPGIGTSVAVWHRTLKLPAYLRYMAYTECTLAAKVPFQRVSLTKNLINQATLYDDQVPVHHLKTHAE